MGFVLRTMFTEGATYMPERRNYQKIFSFTWLWACFVLAQGYSGKLITSWIFKKSVLRFAR